MRTFELLREARALIEDPANWTRGELVNERGQACALGACVLAGDGTLPLALAEAYETLDASAMLLYGGMDITQVNDQVGHVAVMRVFDHAIGQVAPVMVAA